MPWDFALILLVLGVVVPWRGAVRIRELLRQPQLTTADRLAVYASTIAFQWLAVAVVAWRCYARRVGARELGIAIPDARLALAVGAALALALSATQIYSLRRLARVPREEQGILGQVARKLLPQNAVEALAFVALASTVALCEEFLYRGFALRVVANAAGNSILIGVVASAMLFALAHLYQGPRGLITTFVVGLGFALVRVWTQSLAPTIIAHGIADLVAGLAAHTILARPQASSGLPPAVRAGAEKKP